ncbi:hypothetical protein BCR39DRAFT_235341 [Naematelia encephala]|uniref:Uncharacterized protein n=1 Tax=Naematelia encephala TaxID=71784 RepID=A0A1Y2BH53_9TREE|nr:hypothetical protein BCR39DRAFT_235341 [Naematelia encephala]
MYQMGYAHTATMSPIGGSILLSRSHSTLTLSSSDSSGQDGYQPSPQYPALATPNRMGFVQSTPDLTAMEMTPNSRQRSQSSPQVAVDAGAQSPSSGKAQRFGRPSPLNLQRQNSYHGTSPSPRRPVSLSRTNSTQSGLRRSRPGSLAASAFGITPIVGEDQVSPLNSPLTSASSSVGTHSRQRSDVSLAPFMTSMSGMTISPDMSDSGEPGSVLPMQMTVPPLTPITPGQGVANGVFKTTDYGDMATEVPRYATMPNKHYETTHYGHQIYPSSDFGPAYAPQNSAWQ